MRIYTSVMVYLYIGVRLLFVRCFGRDFCVQMVAEASVIKDAGCKLWLHHTRGHGDVALQLTESCSKRGKSRGRGTGRGLVSNQPGKKAIQASKPSSSNPQA